MRCPPISNSTDFMIAYPMPLTYRTFDVGTVKFRMAAFDVFPTSMYGHVVMLPVYDATFPSWP